MKIFNKYRFNFAVLIFTILVCGTAILHAQSSCECQSESCSASQTCPAGYLATCTCGVHCGSQCVKAGSELPELVFETGGPSLIESVIGSNDESISAEFSKSLGRVVVFIKSPNIEKLVVDKPSFKSYWEIAEFLAGKGKLTINRLPFEIWKGHRDTLLNGGEYKICANDLPAQMILDEINFLTERNFRIISGDPMSKVKASIRGASLKEVLDSLSSTRKISIEEIK